MQWKARVSSDLVDLVFLDQSESPIEVETGGCELCGIFRNLSHDQRPYPTGRKLRRRMLLDIPLQLQKSGMDPVIRIADERSGEIASPALR
jgi:hypothetical protein